MQCEIIQTQENWQRIRCEWDHLAEGNPMLSFSWLNAWWQAYGEGSRLQIFVVRDQARKIIGIAPWYECNPLLSPSLRFLGSGKVCSDYLRLICDAHNQTEMRQAMVAQACQRVTNLGSSTFARGLFLEGMSESDPETEGLLSSFKQSGFLVKTSKLESCWQVALPESWDAMLLKLKKNFRRKARKCMDRLENGTFQTRTVDNADGWPEAIELLERLHQARRTSMGETGCFDDPRFAVFLKHAIPPMLAQRKARVIWIESAGQPIAIQLQLIGNSFVGMYQSGIDPAARELEPGHVLIAQAIRQAIDDGFKCYDFLRGDEYYKSAWSAQPTGLVKAWLIPPTIWARSVYYAAEGAVALRQVYRQLRKPHRPNSAGLHLEVDEDFQAAAQNSD